MMGYLGRLPRRWLIAATFALVGLVALADYVTGPDIAVSIFYLVPVSIGAWFIGSRMGVALSLASAVAWFVADTSTRQNPLHWAVPYWNAAVATGFFLIVTRVLAELRAARARQEELGQFVVHDLRSPLTNILLGLQTIQEVGEGCDPAMLSLVGVAVSSAKRMQTLVDSLLDLPRLESGRMPLVLEEVPVAELILSATEQMAIWAQQSNVALALECGEAPAALRTDRMLAQRVLVNLLSNALKFSPAGSKITIRTAEHDSGRVAISVSDQGPGIPRQWQEQVFDKFTQVQARQAGTAIGSGLGLAFCRQAVSALGGRIWLESEPSRGTTITFTLPRA